MKGKVSLLGVEFFVFDAHKEYCFASSMGTGCTFRTVSTPSVSVMTIPVFVFRKIRDDGALCTEGC